MFLINAHLVSLVLWVDSNGRVPQHGLHASGRHDDLRVTPLDLVGERDKDPKLDFILIIRNAEKRTARQLLLINLIIIKKKIMIK